MLSVSGASVETIARQSGEGPRSPRFGGWYGLETHRVQHIDVWVARRERELAEAVLGGPAAVGLHASLAAVNEGAVAHLLVAREDMIAGYVCGRCGALSTGSDECPDWGTAACAVRTCWRRWRSAPWTTTGR